MIKIAELRNKTDKELNVELHKLKRESLNLRFQKVTGELSNTARIRQVRRLVAKIKTVLSEKINKA